MDRRVFKLKRTDIESDTTATITNGSYLSSQPLKDNSNIRIIKVNVESVRRATTSNSAKNQQEVLQITNNSSKTSERPLKCLETLAQKAGITFDEKYDFASPPHSSSFNLNSDCPLRNLSGNHSSSLPSPQKLLAMDKSQNSAQQMTSSAVPLQISPEQLQQLQQHLHLQHNSPFAIQVKQEFPSHTNTGTHQLTANPSGHGEVKHAGILDQNQLQQMQMQLAEAAGSGAGPNSPATQPTPSSAAGSVATVQQHSATISTMPQMQLTSTGQVSGDWGQGRTVQVMQPPTALNSTGFLYQPQMLVSGPLFSGLTQQPIQVITANKPFQSGAPQMITATTQNAKQMIGSNASFSTGTYAIPSSQSPQTFLFSPVNPVNVISPSPQQQNILQTMAAAAAANAQQQQQNMAKVNSGGQDAQKNMQQKVMQKVTAAPNTVQSTASGSSTGAVAQQQQHSQQCVQVSSQTGMPTTTQIIGQIQGANGTPQQMQITAPWLPVWPNGLQQLTQNPIIFRQTQPDGTPGGMFIQQPATATHQTLQTTQQPNQITLQCNVAQPQAKARSQLEALVSKQQQAQAAQTQNSAVNALAAQQQAVAVAAAQLQQQANVTPPRAPQILPQSGSQMRPASSVSTQTAQNQSLVKHKIRSKQQPVRPALPAMKTENGQQKHQTLTAVSTAGLQHHLNAASTQHQPQMHQVVTSAGNKMVVMSTGGPPITIQNGSNLQQATANAANAEKHQQLQYQQLQKQQLLHQQMLQQQLAHIQQQQQQPQQFQLQVSPVATQALLAQQQQQQIQSHLLQQQHQIQQREQQQNIIHQIVVQQSPQQQLQNSLNTSLSQQQQITTVPISVSSATVTAVSSGATMHGQQVVYQSKSNSFPTTSVVTISNQMGPVVTSTVGANQTSQLPQQNIMSTTIASQQQQTTQGAQSQSGISTISSQNPILAMASMAASTLGNPQSNTNSNVNGNNVSSSTIQQSISSPATSSATPLMTATPIKASTGDQQHNTHQRSTPTILSAPVVSVSSLEPGTRIIPLSIASSSVNVVASAVNNSALAAPAAADAKESNTKIKQIPAAEQSNDAALGSFTAVTNNNGDQNFSKSETSQANSAILHAALQQISSPEKTCNLNTATVSSSPKTMDSQRTSSEVAKIVSNVVSVPNQSSPPVSSSPNTEEEQNNSKTSKSAVTANTTSVTTTVSKPATSVSNAKIEKTDLPKAMIKPNVLTHVIDDFIIQEASEPFPVTRLRYSDKDTNDEPPKKKSALDDITANSISPLQTDMVACENCGKVEHKAKLKKKRFCSPSCARLAKTNISDQQPEPNATTETNSISMAQNNTNDVPNMANISEKMHAEQSNGIANGVNTANNQQFAAASGIASNDVGAASATVQVSASNGNGELPQMMNWTVTEVCEFIKNLPGCSDYVDDFEQQEIDGQALLLLKENHLVNAMGMKLGPALKIVAKVESLKEINTSVNASNTASTTEKETTQ